MHASPVAVVTQRAAAPDLTMTSVQTMYEGQMSGFVGRTLATRRTAFGSAAGACFVLVVIGLIGFVGESIVRRRREIGVRLALGGPPLRIVAQIARDAFLLGGAGVALGLFALLLLRSWLPLHLFDVYVQRLVPGLLSPVVVTLAACILIIVSATAVGIGALNALAIRPADVLRQD